MITTHGQQQWKMDSEEAVVICQVVICWVLVCPVVVWGAHKCGAISKHFQEFQKLEKQVIVTN